MKTMLVSKDNNTGDDVQSIIEGGGGAYSWVGDDADIELIIEE